MTRSLGVSLLSAALLGGCARAGHAHASSRPLASPAVRAMPAGSMVPVQSLLHLARMSIGAGVVAHGERLVSIPLRVVLALVVIGAVTATGVWGLVTVLRIKSMTQSERMMAVGGIMVLLAALAMWVIFVWPAYWD